MKLSIETHKYAPELNKILFVRDRRVVSSLSAPGVTSIRQAREKFLKPQSFARVATVTTHYPEKWERLNRTHKGLIRSYADLLDFKNYVRNRTTGGMLLSGEVLPDADIKIKIKMIG